MSGESDDLLYQSETGALLFPNLTDNDELDFTKDFFSDGLNESNDLNGGSYESMGGDDLIAELEVQDVFHRLGTSELTDGTSFGLDLDRKSGMSLSSPNLPKPFANGPILPTYMNFQKPSISLPHMSTGFNGSVSDMYNMHRNGITGLASPTSPSGLLSPGATSEKLNSLTLETHQIACGHRPTYRHQTSFDVKGNVVRGFPMVGSGQYSPGSVHNPEKRFPSSPLSSPSVSQGNSNEILPYTSCGGQDIATSIIVASDVMHSSPTHAVRSTDGASPRSLATSSSETKDSVDSMLGADGGLTIQQNKPLFLSSPGLAQRLGSAVDNSGFRSPVDASGDSLRPLSMHSRAMHRSFSSHALGQLRNTQPIAQGNDLSGSFSRIASADGPSRLSNESGSPHMQPQLPELQNIHIRPHMHAMRRVHSTGDIETLNGMAGGGTSPSSLDRSSYEDGGFKIGRYTMEERKIRIHRYQQKRTQRNFNKKIKYACRKTLADSRPRVRGRFAKNDEVGEVQVKAYNNHKDDEDEEDNPMDDDDGFLDEDSSGDLSDVLGRSGIKLEHPPSKGIKLEHHHNVDRNLLQT